MVSIGQPAPGFTLPNQDGQPVSLSDYRGQKVILFAFPKADTPGCTAQACGFRDAFPQVHAGNAVVLGISADTVADLKAWHTRQSLNYDLLSDPDHATLDAYGAWGELSFKGRTFEAPLRSYWVIDADGTLIAEQIRVTPEDSIRLALDALAE